MRIIAHVLFSGTVAVLASGALRAQGPTVPPIGTSVRLEMQDGERVTGTVLGLDADTMRLEPEKRPLRGEHSLAIPLGAVRAYSVSMGRDRWRGAGRGALVGGILGVALIAYAVHADNTQNDLIIPGTVFAVPGAVILTGLGAGVGALTAPRRWSSPIPLRVGVQRGSAGALRIGLRVDF